MFRLGHFFALNGLPNVSRTLMSRSMPDGLDAITVRVVSSLADVDASAWDACAGNDNPFVNYSFLSALEDSGSATGETGWACQHLIIEDGDDGYLGVAPVYVKSHSYGEYVFDWGWADAYERAGGHYFPKLLCGVPFTPVTGPRLMVAPNARDHEKRDPRRHSVPLWSRSPTD